MQFLSGLKVLEIAPMMQGAAAGMALADLGAEVIKVESPEGDMLRGWGSTAGVRMALPGGRNATYEMCNRNKRGIVLNLKTAQGKEDLLPARRAL